LGVLAQAPGPDRRAVGYFAKQLDEVIKGWPSCLRAVAAVVLNIQEAHKFTMGQKITVLVSHTVSAVLEAKGGALAISTEIPQVPGHHGGARQCTSSGY